METAKVLVIATGGTIDSAYDPAQGTPAFVPTPDTSAIPEALARLGWKEDKDFHFERFYHADSKYLHQHICTPSRIT
jgi:L-asparaginase/Glu-tRNA(Gln) amidotransferase subunit D